MLGRWVGGSLVCVPCVPEVCVRVRACVCAYASFWYLCAVWSAWVCLYVHVHVHVCAHVFFGELRGLF